MLVAGVFIVLQIRFVTVNGAFFQGSWAAEYPMIFILAAYRLMAVAVPYKVDRLCSLKLSYNGAAKVPAEERRQSFNDNRVTLTSKIKTTARGNYEFALGALRCMQYTLREKIFVQQ
ncbi:hypothetical protein TELCIR_13586 [Teladorsagia circumcincta]|uniref:Uncharacterized protein n=1 Tax=Teladorsagia circumcincta TaxID=45464 RepID=A0A2G9U3L1_TELCI|nr:hypothetical protein TELCIR_13586 [Teladorsagia circumcincta]